MANIPVIPPPALLDLPISNHADFYARFVYKPVVVDVNGEPVLLAGKYQFVVADYPAGSSVTLIIDTNPPLVVDAVITDQFAEVLIDKAVTATIGIGSTWSLVLTFADGFDKAIMEGKVILTQKAVTK
jgi:hypothetical protein